MSAPRQLLGADNRVVIESPLAGDTVENFRYLLWCCRAVYLRLGKQPIASHLVCPWFMDDADPQERQDGIDNPWVWDSGVTHYFFEDLGVSKGMALSWQRCIELKIGHAPLLLAEFQEEWAAYMLGGWPTRTKGFALHAPVVCEHTEIEGVGEDYEIERTDAEGHRTGGPIETMWCARCGATCRVYANGDGDTGWRLPELAK